MIIMKGNVKLFYERTSGYLKVISSEELNLIRESDNEYELAITNREILFMFRKMILRWFTPAKQETNEFIKALINGDVESMNAYMKKRPLVAKN